jgi:hypothetical protein
MATLARFAQIQMHVSRLMANVGFLLQHSLCMATYSNHCLGTFVQAKSKKRPNSAEDVMKWQSFIDKQVPDDIPPSGYVGMNSYSVNSTNGAVVQVLWRRNSYWVSSSCTGMPLPVPRTAQPQNRIPSHGPKQDFCFVLNAKRPQFWGAACKDSRSLIDPEQQHDGNQNLNINREQRREALQDR